MRTEPSDFDIDSLATLLRSHWHFEITDLDYAPVGFGSHHWIAMLADGSRRFVTADRVGASSSEASSNLSAAYASAAALRDSGLDFVVAPLPAADRKLLHRIDPEWAVAIFEYLDGKAMGPGRWQDIEARARTALLIGRLHASESPRAIRPFSFALPHESSLFDSLDERWDTGPYAEKARRKLKESRAQVEALLAHYHQLVGEIEHSNEPWVVTHGEPHSANVVEVGGAFYLVDWDTVRLAPAERDLAGSEPTNPRPSSRHISQWRDCGYPDRRRSGCFVFGGMPRRSAATRTISGRHTRILWMMR